MTNKIDLNKYETQQAVLKARLGMLKTYAYLTNKNEISGISKLINETERIIELSKEYNKLSEEDSLSEEKLSEIEKLINSL